MLSRLALVKTASLPMDTPCSLTPISAPQIQYGLDRITAFVWRDLVDLDVGGSNLGRLMIGGRHREQLVGFVGFPVTILAEGSPTRPSWRRAG